MIRFNLRKLLFGRNMNQSDLKRKSGVRYNTINAYYHGYVRRMNVEDIDKMCNVLGCTLDEFMEHIPDK